MSICKYCRYYEQIGGRDIGTCRRHAPEIIESMVRFDDEVVLGIDALLNASEWPVVLFDSWCGEFQDNDRSDRCDDLEALENIVRLRVDDAFQGINQPGRFTGRVRRKVWVYLLKKQRCAYSSGRRIAGAPFSIDVAKRDVDELFSCVNWWEAIGLTKNLLGKINLALNP